METDTKMDAQDSAAPAATAPTTHDINAKAAEEEEEMPVLFMDQLPPNFAQNSQLAAIATFMADSDEDAPHEAPNEASEAGNGRQQRRHQLQKSKQAKRRQGPYVKPLKIDKTSSTTKTRDDATSSDTKELQLFLSLFHVS